MGKLLISMLLLNMHKMQNCDLLNKRKEKGKRREGTAERGVRGVTKSKL